METIELKQNGQAEKTTAQKCMDEIQDILEKHNCIIICVPQNIYGQKVFVPMIEEIKK